MSPSKPANGLKRSAASPAPSGKTDGSAAKRQKVAINKSHASTPTPAAAAAAAQAQAHGTHIGTQLVYTVEYLKSKGAPKTLHELLNHLSLQHLPEGQQRTFAQAMQQHSRIHYNPPPKTKTADQNQPVWRAGTYEFRPALPGVNTKTTLLEYLRSKKDASGTEVKQIKDGWPDCDQAIRELEEEHKILTVRTSKEQTPRYIWLDQSDLHHPVDDEFKAMWFREALPSAEEMPKKLKALGQKATSGILASNANIQKAPQKKKRQQRTQKKFENEHMRSLFLKK
ncbi:hypothetical protein M426DRAFT_316048 [Hypoxylon sp. CI-4A]|nr:hypothetical protein M426DRAFT_316048 [Hypoxylon sp. CI-4A]